MKQSYDVVVIGSGFGGAITACRLAQAGYSVCILEKGRRWQKADFPRSVGEVAAKAFWQEQQRQGFIDYQPFSCIDVIQGCGVGGGSLHYFNVHRQPPATIFEQPRWPRSITLQQLTPYYQMARNMLEARPLKPPLGRELPLRTQAFQAAVQAYGKQAEFVDIAVYTDSAVRNSQSACDYSGNCLLGCHVHAKNTLDLNYIPLAEQHGAEVFPLHKAEKIEPDGPHYRVHISRLQPAIPAAMDSIMVQAGKVVVAAGTLGTNELLLKCRDVYRSLPHLSSTLGTGFSGNGDLLFAGTLYPDQRIDAGRGPSITAGVGFASEGQYIYIEDLGYPDPFLWGIQGALPTRRSLLQDLQVAVSYLLTSLGLDGVVRSLQQDWPNALGYLLTSLELDGVVPANFDLAQLFKGGITSRFLPYLGMGTDAADGVLALDQEQRLTIRWNHRNSIQMFNQMEQHLREISNHFGGHYVPSFFWSSPLRKLLTAHPLGGCALSMSAQQGVVDEFGQVWNYPNLYVADGAIIPTALAVNPSATISALAERVAYYMIHGKEIE